MKFVQVEQFLTIVKHMNMTSAAKELFITQPALSQSISRLENELGLRLFYRDGNRLILSREGEALLDSFQECMSAHDRLIEKTAELTTPNTDKVRLGYCGSSLRFSSFFMTGFFEEKRLGMLSTILYITAQNAEQMLLADEIDFAISSLPLNHPQISSIPLISSRIVLAVPDRHPLSNCDETCVKSLNGQHFVGYIPSAPVRMIFDEVCAAQGTAIQYDYELSYHDLYHAIAANAETGKRLFYTPEDVFSDSFSSGYKLVPIRDKDMTITSSISWLAERKANLRFKPVLDYILTHYEAQMAYHAEFTGILAKSHLFEANK